MKGTDADLSFVLIAATRYALGRRSYAPSLVAGVVADNLHLFTTDQLMNLHDEVLKYEDMGDPCDQRTWVALGKTFDAEIDRRRKSTRPDLSPLVDYLMAREDRASVALDGETCCECPTCGAILSGDPCPHCAERDSPTGS
jgi:hypothetical protein